MQITSKFKHSIIALALLAAGSRAHAHGDSFFVVIPVPGKTVNVSDISVNLGASAQLPDGLMNSPYVGYDFKPLLSVTGDPAFTGYGVKWSLASGNLPAGLRLNADGTISGTPTAGGTSNFTVRASYKTKDGLRDYRILVSQLTVALATGAPPAGIVGEAYSYNLNSHLIVTGDGGAPAAATWALVSGSLPAGLTLRADGTVTGTPTAAGTGQITVRATYKNVSGEQSYQVVSLDIKVLLDSAELPAARVNTQYPGFDFKTKLTVEGDPAYRSSQVTFRALGLPEGMALSEEGLLTGAAKTKNTAGATFDVQASYKSRTGQQRFTLVVKGQQLSVSDISAGVDHTCAVTPTGGAKCWGANTYGQLGNGSLTASLEPVDVQGLATGVRSISAGKEFTCALLTNGGVNCWGRGNNGQLGNSGIANSSVPVQVTGLYANVSRLSAGYTSACAVMNGAAMCWGNNSNGMLGNNSTTRSLVPVSVSGLASGVASVAVGEEFACALSSSGGVKCWGDNGHGQLGYASGVGSSKTPVAVSGLTSGVSTLGAGQQYACALTSGTVKCWGDAAYGQHGVSQDARSYTPVTVSGATGMADVFTGGRHVCAKTVAGAIKCWGNGNSGELGYGSTSSSLALVTVNGLPGAVSKVSGGKSHTCASSAGQAFCWGAGAAGQLGTGTTANQSTPVSVLE